jgi:acylphosphatase
MNGHSIRHVIVRGRVQGVGYRLWMQDLALEHGVEGWVRNRRDGAVEAVFAGPAEAIEQIVAACRRGPPAAAVGGVEQREGSPAELAMRRCGERFSLLPTT